jgi:hypothetical protein
MPNQAAIAALGGIQLLTGGRFGGDHSLICASQRVFVEHTEGKCVARMSALRSTAIHHQCASHRTSVHFFFLLSRK